MALSQESQSEIETMMAGLKKGEYERPGMGQKKFIEVVTGLNAQINKDRDALVNAGLNESKFAQFEGLLEMLVLTFGQRHGIANLATDQRLQFDENYQKAVVNRKYMMMVARHIVDSTDDNKVKNNYKFIVQGKGIHDTLCDVVALEPMIRQYAILASQIKPGGIAIDDTYLTAALKNAVELLRSRGFVVEKGVPQNKSVDALNRISTLCVRAIAEIKKFANAAFIDDPDYYNENYVITTTSNSDDSEDDADVGEKMEASPAATAAL